MKKLIDYIGENSCDPKIALEMIEKLYKQPPSQRYFIKSEFMPESYEALTDESKKVSGAISTLVERSLDQLGLSRIISQHHLSLFGYVPDSKENAMKLYLFSRAAIFKFAHVGACSYRASYAAIYLAKTFLNCNNVHVALISAPARDQFAVLLGNKK